MEYLNENNEISDYAGRSNPAARGVLGHPSSYVSKAIDFGSAFGFHEEHHSGRIFVMTFNSTLDAPESIVLMPSYASLIKGKKVATNGDIVVVGDKKITGTGSPALIQELHAFLKENPSNLLGVRIKTDNTDQFQKILSVRKDSPFKEEQSKELFLGTYVKETSNREDIISVATPDIVLSHETELSLPIVPGTTTITLFVGAVLSQATKLHRYTKEAYARM